MLRTYIQNVGQNLLEMNMHRNNVLKILWKWKFFYEILKLCFEPSFLNTIINSSQLEHVLLK